MPRHPVFEIQVLTWDRHSTVARLSRTMGPHPPPPHESNKYVIVCIFSAFIGRITYVAFPPTIPPTGYASIVIQLLTSCFVVFLSTGVLLIAFKLMCITKCVISCVENGILWIICFSKKYKLYRVA